jgi:hypothetical protein
MAMNVFSRWWRVRWTRNAVLASVAAHLAFLSFAGVYVAIRVLHKPQSILQAEPPPRPALDLRTLEMRVSVADLQRQSARPQLQPRMVAQRPSKLALPDIQADPEAVRRPVRPVYTVVGAPGFGAGIGGGLGVGSGGGGGEVTFFGLKGVGEKVCLIVDVSLSMCEDERGGVAGYQRVKAEVAQVIRSLKPGVLFNVVVFENGVGRCWKQLQPVNTAHQEEAIAWFNRYNQPAGPYGLPDPNHRPGAYGMPAEGGTSRLDLALTAAFELGADAIFVLTDGLPRVIRDRGETGPERDVYDPGHQVTDAEIRDWERRLEAWEEEQEERARKGLGPRLREGGGVAGPPPRPRDSPAGTRRVRDAGAVVYWTPEDILAHIKTLQQTLYVERGRKPAAVHAVGYGVERETRRFLRDLARDNDGQYRSIEEV